jgi:2-polyprenyl-3-methyl-5-hydroxy-6-metoxy-1,4-benzoquinol methylase
MSIDDQEHRFDQQKEVNERCHICNGPLTDLFPFGDAPKVVHCEDCHTESIRPLPTMKELEDHYADYVITKTPEDELLFLTSLSTETLGFYLKKTDYANTPASSIRFLEIGFGNGAGLFAGSKLGWQSYGVDLDPVCVANARTFAEKHSIPATCAQGGVHTLSHLGIKFDLVKASQILEHVINPVEFLSMIAQSQPAGGYLIIECPNNQAAFWRLKNKARASFDRLNYYNSLKLREHLWGYTRKSLPLLLQKAGYRTVFLRDYAVGNAIFEPQSVLWYPTLRNGIRESLKQRNLRPLLYPGVRAFDAVSSALLRMGTGFAALCQKVDSGTPK